MPEESDSSVRVRISVSPAQAALIDRFQAHEKIATRAEAVRLLLEIGLDSISSKGGRFWDDPPK